MKKLTRKEEILVLKSGINLDKVKQECLKLLNEIISTREDFLYSCDDKKLFSLYEKLIKLIQENTTTKEKEVEYFQEETLEEIKKKCGENFIAELKELFRNKYHIHATNIDDPNVFFEDAFRIYGSYELATTAYTSLGSIDQILFSLFNKMHLGLTKIVVLDAEQEDVKTTGKSGAYANEGYIPKEYIKAYIDLDNLKIIYNPHYKKRLVMGENRFIDKQTEPDEPIMPKFEIDYFDRDEEDFDIGYLCDVEINLLGLTDMIGMFPDEDGYSINLNKQFVDYSVKVLERLKKVDIQKYRDEYSIEI